MKHNVSIYLLCSSSDVTLMSSGCAKVLMFDMLVEREGNCCSPIILICVVYLPNIFSNLCNFSIGLLYIIFLNICTILFPFLCN
uniref:Uncharacterized protein n=1 Tax=Noccaea caerulescens TaxID=107243 RepID=A0A1J3CQ35_NOCCA